MIGIGLWGFDQAAVEAFRAAYWLAQPGPVRVLQATPASQRYALAVQLAMQGYKIDEDIMVDGGEPLIVMVIRLANGFTWVPNAAQQNLPTMPGADLPGLPAYDPKNPPPGSIIVSTNIADFPPFDPPAAPTTPITIPIGPKFGGFQIAVTINGAQVQCDVYASSAQQHFPEGQQATVIAPIPANLVTVGVVVGKYSYHLLGSELMAANERTGVWLLLPATS